MLSTLIADRNESWSLALAQCRALSIDECFERRNSSYIMTRLIVTLLHYHPPICWYLLGLLFDVR
jgi:hypothetical protein